MNTSSSQAKYGKHTAREKKKNVKQANGRPNDSNLTGPHMERPMKRKASGGADYSFRPLLARRWSPEGRTAPPRSRGHTGTAPASPKYVRPTLPAYLAAASSSPLAFVLLWCSARRRSASPPPSRRARARRPSAGAAPPLPPHGATYLFLSLSPSPAADCSSALSQYAISCFSLLRVGKLWYGLTTKRWRTPVLIVV
jgi:hypothetical protein